MTHRTVRVMPELYRQLETQLPTERGPRGEPTVAEFAASDLLDIVDIFAEQWDDLLKGIPGRSDYRDLWFDSRLVYAVVVRGQLSPVDGAIELVDIIIDVHGPEFGDPDEDEQDD